MFTLLVALCCVMASVARGSDPCSAPSIAIYSNSVGVTKTTPAGAENCASFSGGVVSILMTPGYDLTLPNLESIEATDTLGFGYRTALSIAEGPGATATGGWILSMPKLKSISGIISGLAPETGGPFLVSAPILDCWNASSYSVFSFAAGSSSTSNVEFDLGSATSAGVDIRGSLYITDTASGYDLSASSKIKSLDSLHIHKKSAETVSFDDLVDVRNTLSVIQDQPSSSDPSKGINLPKLKGVGQYFQVTFAKVAIYAPQLILAPSIVVVQSTGSISGPQDSILEFDDSSQLAQCNCASPASIRVFTSSQCEKFCSTTYKITPYTDVCSDSGGGSGGGGGGSGGGGGGGGGGSSSSSSSSAKLSDGAIAGVVIAILFVMGLLAGGYVLSQRHKTEKTLAPGSATGTVGAVTVGPVTNNPVVEEQSDSYAVSLDTDGPGGEI